MSFSDSDWTRDPPLRARVPLQQRRALTLAIAIAVSCVAIALAVYGIEQWLDASAHSETLRRRGDVAAVEPPSAGVTPTAVAASAAPPAVEPVASSAPPHDSSAASAPAAPSPADLNAQQLVALEAEMRQRAHKTAEQAAVEAARRKDRAWQRFYQSPDFCADNPNAAQMVQCSNHHIRARKEFEERYATGKL